MSKPTKRVTFADTVDHSEAKSPGKDWRIANGIEQKSPLKEQLSSEALVSKQVHSEASAKQAFEDAHLQLPRSKPSSNLLQLSAEVPSFAEWGSLSAIPAAKTTSHKATEFLSSKSQKMTQTGK